MGKRIPLRLDTHLRKVSSSPLPFDYQYALSSMLVGKIAEVRGGLTARLHESMGSFSSPEFNSHGRRFIVQSVEVRSQHPLHSKANLRTLSPILERTARADGGETSAEFLRSGG